jgi:hypothetical protein
MNVNHRQILDLFGLLRRVSPEAVVVGRQEMLRIGGLVFTLELAKTIFEDTYNGFVLTVVNPAVGKLDAAVLTLREHDVAWQGAPLVKIDAYGSKQLVEAGTRKLQVQELENAVRNYVTVFAG